MPSEKKFKVLLIEDEPDTVSGIQLALRDTVFDLEWRDSLTSGIERLSSGSIDLVLLDLGLPDSQGYATFKKLHELFPSIAVVVQTALSDETIAVKAMHEGAQDYLIKGKIDIDILLRSMRYAVERHHAEKALEEAKEYTDKIIAGMADALIVIEPDGSIRTVNPVAEMLLGWSAEEITGKIIKDIFAGDAALKEAITEVLLRQGPLRDHRAELITKKGETIPVDISTSQMDSPEGIPQRIVMVAHDMRMILALQNREKELSAAAAAEKARTEALDEARAILEREVEKRTDQLRKALDHLRRTEEELVQAEKMSSLGMLAGGVAHEINTPLSAVLGYASLLLKELPEKSSFRKDLQEIEKAALQCKEIIGHLLSFSKRDMKLKSPADLNQLLLETLSLIGSRFQMEKINIFTDLENKLPLPLLNTGTIQQVFVNVIKNAWQAMPEGGELHIATRKEDECIAVVFSDTGPGIPLEILPYIFDPFVTTKPIGSAPGLGLSVSYGIVKDHGGTVQAGNSEPHGAEITIRLPIIKQP